MRHHVADPQRKETAFALRLGRLWRRRTLFAHYPPRVMLKRKARHNIKGRTPGHGSSSKQTRSTADAADLPEIDHAHILNQDFISAIDPSRYDSSNPLIITEEDQERKRLAAAQEASNEPKRAKLSAKKTKALKKIVLIKYVTQLIPFLLPKKYSLREKKAKRGELLASLEHNAITEDQAKLLQKTAGMSSKTTTKQL